MCGSLARQRMMAVSTLSYLLFLFFSLFSIIIALNCKGFVTQHGRLSVNNNQLIDSYGEAIQLRGLSSSGFGVPNGNYPYSCVTKESITYVVQNYGVNLFRFPILISTEENGYETNQLYYDQYIDNVVKWCEDLGIYVIIDWHVTNPYGDPNHWLTSPGASTGLAITFWKKVATKFKTKLHVIYEIANEPNNVTWTDVLLYHNSVIAEIRAIDPNNLIIAGTTHWSQDIGLPLLDPVAQPSNVMYSFHFYAASHGYLYDYAESYIDKIPVFAMWAVSESSGSGNVSYTVADQYLELFAGLSGALTTTSWTMSAMSDSGQTSSTLIPSSCTQKKWTSLTDTGKYINDYLLNTTYFINHDLTWCNEAPTGEPTGQPTSIPTISFRPTSQPSSSQPTGIPSSNPTYSPPTHLPTIYVKAASTNSQLLSTGAIVGIALGGLAIILIAFLVITWVVKSSVQKHKYQNPEGDIAMKEGAVDVESVPTQVDNEQTQADNEYLSTSSIYRQTGDSSISRDVTVMASHDSTRDVEDRGRTAKPSTGKSTKRPSHSPPRNPLHQKNPKRRSKSPVPQGSKKKRDSSRSPSPGR